MAANTPKKMLDTFFESFNAGDLESLLALYETEATFVDEPGKVVQGVEAVRKSLAGFMSMKPKLKLLKHQTLVAGNIATNLVQWTLTGTGPDGEAVSMDGRSIDVIRQQPDGSWKIVIDNPWGVAILD